jgi:hypothetical protein
VPNSQLAFYLETNDEKENREQSVIDPVLEGHPKGGVANGEADLLVPESGEGRTYR